MPGAPYSDRLRGMDWLKIVRVFAVSYVEERDAAAAISLEISEAEPGVWRVLFDPALYVGGGIAEIGMIIVTGVERLAELPDHYMQVCIEDSDGEDGLMLWGWPLRGYVTDSGVQTQ